MGIARLRASVSAVAQALNQLEDYCAPKTNYADIRKRVNYAFAEKAHEIADATAVVQSLSKEATRLLGEIDAQCS